MGEQQTDWTNDQDVLDRIRAHISYSFDAVVEDNPEIVSELCNGYLAGRIRLVFSNGVGCALEELKGYVAVPRTEDVPGS